MPHRAGGGYSRSSTRVSRSRSYIRVHIKRSNAIADSLTEDKDYISKTYYRGSSRYGYKDKHGDIQYVYSDTDLTKQGKNLVWYVIKAVFVFIVVMYIFNAMGVFKPLVYAVNGSVSKLQAADDYKIDDSADIISVDDERVMLDVIECFYVTTGIPICVTTTKYFADDCSDIYDRTYNYYIRHYKDEKHIVFLYAKNEAKGLWDWEAVQGFDTDNIVTSEKFDIIAERINENMYNSVDFESGFISAVGTSTEYIMDYDLKSNVGAVSFYMLIILVGIIEIITIIRKIREYKRYFLDETFSSDNFENGRT